MAIFGIKLIFWLTDLRIKGPSDNKADPEMRAEIRNTTRRTTLRLLLSWRKCTTNIRPRNFCDLLVQLAFPTFTIYDPFATDVNFTTCWCNRPQERDMVLKVSLFHSCWRLDRSMAAEVIGGLPYLKISCTSSVLAYSHRRLLMIDCDTPNK